MTTNEPHKPDFDWRVTSFEGSRREQLRRWAQLPAIADAFRTAPARESPESARSSSIKEPPAPYRGKRGGIKSK
jgi:hypothetical protein